MGDGLLKTALALHQAGKLDEAERRYRQILQVSPRDPIALHYLGVCEYQRGNHASALELITAALAASDHLPMGNNNLGLVLRALNRKDEALSAYAKSIETEPNNYTTYNNRGILLHELGRYEEALLDYDRALELNPGFAEGYCNRGRSRVSMRLLEAARDDFKTAVTLNPRLLDAYLQGSEVLHRLGQFEDALRLNKAALAINPGSPDIYAECGAMLLAMKRYDEALRMCDEAISIDSGHALAHINRAAVLHARKRYAEANESYEKAYSLGAGHDYFIGSFIYNKYKSCDWKRIDVYVSDLFARLERDKRASQPFNLLFLRSTPAQQLKCARRYVADKHFVSPVPPRVGDRYTHGKIRVGYFSSDFRRHPVAYLLINLIECHDRERFDVVGFMYGPSENDPWTRRMEKSFDRFFDVREMSDTEITRLIRDEEIDILVDLNGHTSKSRSRVLAYRPAPVQVNYLGYVSTMGAEYVDYIIGDYVVIPDEHRRFYAEKVVRLPYTFQANGLDKPLSEKEYTRADLGLPEKAVVFCCFNNSYKISPDVFDIWMRLLCQIEGSILWLFGENDAAVGNLREEAERRGVSADRLVFAEKAGLADYLERYKQADLFLDTFHYNAGTTASDALWAGLPVLTCLGNSFPSRMAASLLNAVGLPELIAKTPDEYERLALKLAKDSAYRQGLRTKLQANRGSWPLFDARYFAKQIESAFEVMQARHVNGAPPDHIDIGKCAVSQS